MLLCATDAHAVEYRLTYTGNTFTSVSGPYTTSDRVTADFIIDIRKISDLPFDDYTNSLQGLILMTDGVRSLSWPTDDPDKFPEFRFATGPSGIPTAWQIAINSYAGNNSIFTYTFGCVFSEIGPACDFTAFGEN